MVNPTAAPMQNKIARAQQITMIKRVLDMTWSLSSLLAGVVAITVKSKINNTPSKNYNGFPDSHDDLRNRYIVHVDAYLGR